MADPFPSLTGSVQQDCETAWRQARSCSGDIKQKTTDLNASSAAGTMTSSQVLNYASFLSDMKLQLNAAAAVQGIVAYAQAQINNPAFDLAGSFTAMVAAIDNTTSWIVTNFPKTPGTNELRAKTFAVDNSGRTVDVVFTAAATSTFRTQLAALLATIN